MSDDKDILTLEETNKKILLIDIDYTIMDGSHVRPYLKEFLERMKEKYHILLYTGASFSRITDVCRVLYHDMGFERDFIRDIQMDSLCYDNCPPIMYHKEDGGVIEIKSMAKASEVLGIPQENLLLLDDNPTYDHPHKSQIIQVDGYMHWKEDQDDYLNTLEITDENFGWIGTPDAEDSNGGKHDFKSIPNNYGNDFVGVRPSQKPIVKEEKINRNEPCPCGSGKKYKKCCIN